MDYLEKNYRSYEESYANGWGNRYTDTEWVTIFQRCVKKNIKLQNVKVLDFGCSLGANSRYFRDLGYDVYGIDISDTAIKKCIEINNFSSKKFKVANLLENDCNLNTLFFDDNMEKFDVIFASEVLYYFNDTDIKNVLEKFDSCLSENGFFLASMVTWNHPYYRSYKKDNESRSFANISNCSNIEESLYVNVMNNKDDVKELFLQFECYDIITSWMDIDGGLERIFYIGKKKDV